MNNYDFENISNLLKKIIIFDDEYKSNILDKAANLDPAGLMNIHDLLFEIESWQRAAFEEKLKNDPTAVDKLSKLITARDQILSKMKTEFHAEKDKTKLTKVLSYIDKI